MRDRAPDLGVRDAGGEQRLHHRGLADVLDRVDVRVALRLRGADVAPARPLSDGGAGHAHERADLAGEEVPYRSISLTAASRSGTRSLRRIAATCERTVAGDTTSVRAIWAVVILRRISSSTSHSREVKRGSSSRDDISVRRRGARSRNSSTSRVTSVTGSEASPFITSRRESGRSSGSVSLSR